ncbi:MAG: rRNA (guanine966-N2)-methyltransferase, partial [Frankiaceae bacterium]|nr:rRNA (guanine966-N2)-methyltransferase [Frankiaceae bacterium]
FLDLYAGSGAVGLEAASRGAAPVVLVERDAKAVRAVRDNVAAIGLPDIAVRADDVSRFLREPATPYEVVFLDPPYADSVDDVLALLAGGGWLAPGATVVVERDSRGAPPSWPPGIEADRSRRYGDSALWYGRRP